MNKVLKKLSGIGESINTMYSINNDLHKAKASLFDISKTIEEQQMALEQNTLTCKEICEAYGITEPTLIKRRNAGLIPFIKLGRNFYYLRPGAAACSK